MASLPVRKKDYDFAVLISDFISKIKKADQDCRNAYNFRFTPEIKGYEIACDEFRIVIKRKLLGGIRIRKYINGSPDIGKNFSSHSPQDNECIINKILE